MQTRQELEEEIKTFKGLRRIHYKDAILVGITTLMCAPYASAYIQTKESGMTIFAGVATLGSAIFSSKNISEIKEDNRVIKETYKKIERLDDLLTHLLT